VKRALAYYRLGNVKLEQGDEPYESDHAFYSASELGNMMTGLDIQKGKVTIMGGVNVQRKLDFGSDVYFGNTVKITGNEGHIFKDNVYFDDDVEIQNGSVTFKGSVGFNKKLNTTGNSLNVDGNVIMNRGNIVVSDDNFQINGTNFYYTENFPIQTSPQPDRPLQAHKFEFSTLPITKVKDPLLGPSVKEIRRSQGFSTYITFELNSCIPFPPNCQSSAVLGQDDCVSAVDECSPWGTKIIRVNENRANDFVLNWGEFICSDPTNHPYCCQVNLETSPKTKHSDMLSPCVWVCKQNNSGIDKIVCTNPEHVNGHIRISNDDSYVYKNASGDGNENDKSNKNRVTSSTKKDFISSTDVLDNLGMKPIDKPIDERWEKPQLDISRIDRTKVLNFDPMLQDFRNDGPGFINKLNTLYSDTSNRFDGHLVVEITSYANLPPMNDLTFDGKVMFIIKDKGTFEASGFYNSGPEASTLIYADKGNATIVNFDIIQEGGGNFRGLICIDPLNTSQNHNIKLGQGGKPVTIHGAIHNFSPNANVDFAGGNQILTIDFDKTVLGAFNCLSTKKCPGSDWKSCCESKKGDATASYITDPDDPTKTFNNVDIKALGYYFY